MRSPRSRTPRKTPELSEALLDLHQHLDLVRLLEAILGQAASLAGAEAGFVYGPGDGGRALVPCAATLPDSDPRLAALQPLEPARLESWLGGEHGRFEGLGPLGETADAWPDEPPIAASLLFGIRTESGASTGALWLLFREEPDRGLAGTIAELLEAARPALRNALQVRAMRELVIKDDTASCFNRRYFDEFLPEELARASRFRAPLSLIFFDLDNLKEINNEYGHAMGSRTLLEVSFRVRGRIRKFDRLFRFGGDEFCVLLPETEWHGALEVAERVRAAIAAQSFLADPGGIGGGVQITASFGIASFPLHARTKEDLIHAADRAMQKIKNETKNAVGVAEIVEDEHGC